MSQRVHIGSVSFRLSYTCNAVFHFAETDRKYGRNIFDYNSYPVSACTETEVKHLKHAFAELRPKCGSECGYEIWAGESVSRKIETGRAFVRSDQSR
jgi:hypothetical protein